jgi:type III secretion protein J
MTTVPVFVRALSPSSSPLARALCVLVLLGAQACSKEELVHGLTEPEANEIVHVLESGGIKSLKEKEEGGRTVTYKVVVAGGDAFPGRKILVENQLPRMNPWGLGKIYDPANKGMIPTATEEDAAYQMALQGEISIKLRSIPGVVDAHVTLVKPKRDVVRDLTDKPPPATASVTILYNMVEGKMPFRLEDIQRLVAGSVEGMDHQNVTVVASLNRPTTKRMTGVSGEEDDGSGTIDKSRSPKFLGIAVVDGADLRKLQVIVTGAGITILIAVLGFVMMMAAFVTQKKKLTEVSTELTSFRKARKAEAAPPAA